MRVHSASVLMSARERNGSLHSVMPAPVAGIQSLSSPRIRGALDWMAVTSTAMTKEMERCVRNPREGEGGPLHRAVGVRLLFGFIFLVFLFAAAHAVEPGEILKDPALETRARKISQELRCVVCQNQSIDDSNAPLAHDLRVLVRERLAAGDTDTQVLAFVEARYGAFVLLRPPFKPQTLLLWLTPLLLLGGAAIFLLRARSRQPASAAAPLSAEEQKRLDALLARRRSER
jgi:cytochrome c-type biogenesis protein CcmH